MPAKKHDIEELISFSERPDGSMSVEPKTRHFPQPGLSPEVNAIGGLIEQFDAGELERQEKAHAELVEAAKRIKEWHEHMAEDDDYQAEMYGGACVPMGEKIDALIAALKNLV